ncbi:MAG: hypothetical protein R3Y53_09915 [Bacillota bacterium]
MRWTEFGDKEAYKIVPSFGVSKVGDLDPSQYILVIQKIKEITEKERG